MKVTLLFVLFTLAFVAAVPAMAHHGHYDVTCYTRNARGERFEATGYSEHAHDRQLWSELQREAHEECHHSRSLICIDLGCSEFYHHE